MWNFSRFCSHCWILNSKKKDDLDLSHRSVLLKLQVSIFNFHSPQGTITISWTGVVSIRFPCSPYLTPSYRPPTHTHIHTTWMNFISTARIKGSKGVPI